MYVLRDSQCQHSTPWTVRSLCLCLSFSLFSIWILGDDGPLSSKIAYHLYAVRCLRSTQISTKRERKPNVTFFWIEGATETHQSCNVFTKHSWCIWCIFVNDDVTRDAFKYAPTLTQIQNPQTCILTRTHLQQKWKQKWNRATALVLVEVFVFFLHCRQYTSSSEHKAHTPLYTNQIWL